MDLKEFTKQTLVQIVEGSHEVNEYFSKHGGRVHIDKEHPKFSEIRIPITIDVEFDVAVTTTEAESANGGGGLRVAGLFNAGGNIENKAENQTISRVKYTLQLELSKEN